jgi:RNA polymerase sigma-70 factor (ECF subfamily)
MVNAFDTAMLLQCAANGDAVARAELLERHRDRLRRMLAVRMDSRLSRRIDPSDIVQETLVQADKRLDKYLDERPLPFYPWLRQLAWDQLVAFHRKHVLASRRTRRRERELFGSLSDESVAKLASCLVDPSADPLRRLVKEELRNRIRLAIDQLPDAYREIIVLRHLEQLTNAEAAEVLSIGVSAAKMRHLRALERLRGLVDESALESSL